MVQHQARGDRAEAIVEKYEPVRELIEQNTAKSVASAVKNYIAFRNSEAFGEDIRKFELTGQLPTRTGSAPKVEDEDEYKTPEEQRMDAIEARLAEAESGTNANTLASGRQVLQGHMEKVFSVYGFTPEDVVTMKARMNSQFDAWGNAGPAGVSAMESISSPSGYSTVQGIMLSGLEPEVLLRAATNATSARRSGLSNLATDGPSGIASTGTEPPPEFDNLRDAVAWAVANPDGHDSY